MTCGPASFTLVTLPVKEYPRLPELPLLAGTVDGGALATAIGQVAPAASRDDTLPVITGVNVEIDGDSIRLVATDRYRLAIRELGWNPARADTRSTMLVPAKTLADAARMMAPGVPVRVMIRGELGSQRPPGQPPPARGDSLHAAEAMIGFESAGRRLTTRLIAGEYIKYMSRFPEGFGSRGDMPADPAHRSGQAGGAGRGAGQFGAALVRPRQGDDRGRHRGTGASPGDGGRRLHRRGDRDRVQPALPDGRPGRGPDRGHRRPRRRDKPPRHRKGPGREGSAEKAQAEKAPDGDAAEPEQARICLQFTSPTKPALITGSAGDGDDSAPDYRYLVVPLRALASA